MLEFEELKELTDPQSIDIYLDVCEAKGALHL